MSQIHTRQMGRLVAAGTLDCLDDTIHCLARIRALHLVDYDGSDDDLDMGSPHSSSDQLSRDVNKLRNAAGLVAAKSSTVSSVEEVRATISGDLNEQIDVLMSTRTRIDEIEASLNSLSEEESMLSMVEPLGLDIDLLGGYKSLTCFVGTVSDISSVSPPDDGYVVHGVVGKKKVIGVFVRNEDSAEAQENLDSAGFTAITIPDCSGSISDRIQSIDEEKADLVTEMTSLNANLEAWSNTHSDSLHASLELLERDQELATAPVRVAVTNHSFIIDGWVEMARADEVKEALRSVCTVVDVEPFKIKPGGGGHGHSDHHHHQEMPPIAFQDRTASKPMELLTDAVGRPGYGRIDPTLFMFITYPIFFGLMLGDMAYGIFTLALGVTVMRKSGTNELMKLGGKFLVYIGTSTIIFGYIYGEFAGFEYLPHYACAEMTSHGMAAVTSSGCHWEAGHAPGWISWMTMLYPQGGEIHWTTNNLHTFKFLGIENGLPFGLELVYPFHRVTDAAHGGNLEDLILLTIYLGVAHVLLGLFVGFRDIWLYGNGHGDQGFACAAFEKGSWILILLGGFCSAYAFLSIPAYNEKWVNPDQGYIDAMNSLMLGGTVFFIIGLVMLMWALYRYHGVPFPINIGLSAIEAIGMLPTVLSYVRLFAVGVVGVKIAETGNTMLYDSIDFGSPFVAIILIIGWLMVQLFAWVLGVFSPNIHAVRLHFVEWMRQFYDASGEAFKPFGFKARRVEVE